MVGLNREIGACTRLIRGRGGSSFTHVAVFCSRIGVVHSHVRLYGREGTVSKAKG